MPKRSNRKGLDELVDKAIVSHLISPFRFEGIGFFLRQNSIQPSNKAEYKKILNRLRYLKKIQQEDNQSFIDLCIQYNLQAPSSKPATPPATKSSKGPVVDTIQPPSTTKTPKPTMSKTIVENEIGDSIVLKLTSGLYFVLLWIDTKLDTDMVELKVSDNGKMIIKRTKKPTDDSALKLLRDLGYGFDRKHVVTANLQDELDRLNKARTEEWDEECLIVMDEEVVREFVDEDGTPTKRIGYSPDADGRYRVSFFLQSVKYNTGTPLKFRLATPNQGDVDFEDQTVSDIDEVRDEIKGLARNIDHAIASRDKQIREEMRYDMGKMMEQLVQVLRSPEAPAQQQQHHHQAYPDQAFSSWNDDDVLKPLIDFGKEVERELAKFS